MLSPDQIRKYVEARFSGERIGYRKELSLRCPFHEDRTASLSFNTEKGVWNCHAGCGGGGVLDFEMKFSEVDAPVGAQFPLELAPQLVPVPLAAVEQAEQRMRYRHATSAHRGAPLPAIGLAYSLCLLTESTGSRLRPACAPPGNHRLPVACSLVAREIGSEVVMHLSAYRAGGPRAPGEGLRIGTVRYVPRGVRREDYALRAA